MSLDDPGLSTVPVDSDLDEHREQRRPSETDTAMGQVDPAAMEPRRSPDELIALAEQEQADRRTRDAAVAAQAPAPGRPGDPDPRTGAPRRRRARKVRRIIRRVDAWSVLKVSLLFFFCVYVIAMVAGVLLWSAAQQAGTIEGFEGFIADLGAYETFTFEGDQIFNGALLAGLVLVIAGSAGNVLLAVLFNLISDLTGGLRVTVIEEEQTGAGQRRRATDPQS